MSYQVLARKWRPRKFEEMVGQQHVLRALINALDNDRLHHAYLFTGTRGVGKTTIARILAKSLNCEQGVSSSPCGECATCREVDEGRFVDLIEVDAASRTKVDETRELLDNVQYAPTRGRYKVYLIDEVHMFSNHSFNALLKTLEEPPPHVKFLLATTDPQKLPVTILSRCLQFNLKSLAQEPIRDHLAHIIGEEGVPFEPAALQQLARAAQGSMRDALSLLDQAIAYGGGDLKDDDVCTMLGVIGQHYVVDLLDALAVDDATALLECVQRMSEQTVNYEAALADVLSMLQRMAIAQVVPEAVDDTMGDKDTVLRLAGQFSAEDIQLYYQVALLGRRDLNLSPDLRGGFEMLMLRMLAFRPVEEGESAPARQAEKKIIKPVLKRPAAAAAAVETIATSEAVVDVSPPVSQVSEAAARPAYSVPADTGDWASIVESLNLGGFEHQLAVNCCLRSRKANCFNLSLSSEHAQLHNDKFESRIQEALQAVFGKQTRLTIEVGVQVQDTPAQQQARARDERQQQAETTIAGDSIVQSLQERFGASVQTGSVKPID
ncbi:DNA polymerase III subunit gamma/tau [Sulfuriflexus mobilis]|uniref:DNA polymerase III subunit gamma/tau n=1 Tax=Sulfuriflexus mobilis TaxID=1811807 RepID=UPI000F845513|nr:DNA polymerase III subunit gamma/tau [Sulfuriflexus mobilis]